MEKYIDYKFKNKNILDVALTHSSYAHESKDLNTENNERLEFLGDAVLELVVSSFIFKEFLELPEGELTKLRASVVCEGMLAQKARNINLGDFLKLGKGEEITGGRHRESILADAFEAVIGAVFLDGGFQEAEKFILYNMKQDILNMRNNFKLNDCKTYLQELIQKTSKEPIEYTIIDEIGPAHEKSFVVQVMHSNKVLGKGFGRSKKEAEQNAALNAINKIEN